MILANSLFLMVKKIPNFSGFDSADGFMNFFTAHLQGLTISEINSIMAVYYRNNQCTLRGRHSSDNRFVKKYIETHDHTDDAEESLNQENVNPTPTLDK